MTIGLRIDPGDPSAPYEQLRRQVVEHVVEGRLPEGARLPPVRQLAGDLGLAAGTVARAYRELESAGIVRTRRGGGTTVAPGAAAGALGASGAAADPADALLAQAVSLARAEGWTDGAIRDAVERALSRGGIRP